jgi:hypothetical protein
MYTRLLFPVVSLDFDSLDAKQGDCNHHKRNFLISLFLLSARKNILCGEHLSEIISQEYLERPLLSHFSWQ